MLQAPTYPLGVGFGAAAALPAKAASPSATSADMTASRRFMRLSFRLWGRRRQRGVQHGLDDGTEDPDRGRIPRDEPDGSLGRAVEVERPSFENDRGRALIAQDADARDAQIGQLLCDLRAGAEAGCRPLVGDQQN